MRIRWQSRRLRYGSLAVVWWAAAVTCAVSAQRPAAIDRDWDRDPAIVVVETDEDVFALGDVHGDYTRMTRLLAAAGVIDGVPAEPSAIKWSAKKSVLVCTGDLIDKGNDSLKVIAAMRALSASAAAAGGKVIVTMGNHEAEFLADPQNKKGAAFLEEVKREAIDPADVAAGRDSAGIGAFLRRLPFAARVNDWFFAHAGHTRGQTLDDLAAALKAGVMKDGFGATILTGEDSLLEARLKDHLWWDEPGDADGAGEARLRKYVTLLGAKHLVIGHQPEKVTFDDGTHRKKGEMFQKFDGLIFLIDVGMSEAINDSEGSLLRIHGHDPLRATIIDSQGNTTRLWAAH